MSTEIPNPWLLPLPTFSYSDRWNITLTSQGKEHSWALAPKGYLPPENVTGISCGPTMACTAANSAPGPSVDYGCVNGGAAALAQ